MWDATADQDLAAYAKKFQSTRPVWGATESLESFRTRILVSIHAPHAGRDNTSRMIVQCRQRFNPRAPCGARQAAGFINNHHVVSIHAPHAGRDDTLRDIRIVKSFNPRAPCGARQQYPRCGSCLCAFQSTRPMRGATTPRRRCGGRARVSIHAPHAGRDPVVDDIRLAAFVSIHAPHAGRDAGPWACWRGRTVSIHAPHAGRDLEIEFDGLACELFQSTRPMRGATRCVRPSVNSSLFQSTRPMRGATTPTSF